MFFSSVYFKHLTTTFFHLKVLNYNSLLFDLYVEAVKAALFPLLVQSSHPDFPALGLLLPPHPDSRGRLELR